MLHPFLVEQVLLLLVGTMVMKHCCVDDRAPMAFFHTTPLGRIINRLTKDTVDADKNLADFAAFFLRSLLQLASTIVLIGVVTPFALPALVPILLVFYFLYQYFQVRVAMLLMMMSLLCMALLQRLGSPGPQHW